MKQSKKLLSLLLCAIMVLGTVAVGGNGFAEVLDTFSVKASAYSTGDYIYYGTYPQSEVTDSSLISKLNSAGGSWKSYNYYSSTGIYDDGKMSPSDYMKYTDIEYQGHKYRAVTFDTYRPSWTDDATSTSCGTYQDDNGYLYGNVYWFKYEPIKWRVLDPSTGMVMAETILDSQTFNNYILHANWEYYGNSAKTYYANNYTESSIRKWLNDDFYNTAFSSSQQSNILYTTLDNSAYSTSYSAYDSESTTDKVFLLSYDDVLNSKYGFATSTGTYDSARQLKGSDYAKSQGLYVYHSSGSSYDGCSTWRLRSPGYSSCGACYVDSGGLVDLHFNTYGTHSGVVPALKLSNLKSDISESEINDFHSDSFSQKHVVDSYLSKNKSYQSKYLSELSTPLDGSGNNPDFCIPGLSKGENMVPQGVAYFNNQLLITSYYKDGTDKKSPSRIFALDFKTGLFCGEYKMVYDDGSTCKDMYGHVGGIAVSGNNIYVSDGKYIYYLNADNMKDGIATFTDRKQIFGAISGLKSDANCAYVTVTDGILWTGNFYDNDDKNYKKPAKSNCNSVVLGFDLTGTGDESEWESFKAKSIQDYNFDIPNDTENIQCATVYNGSLILTMSFGRKNTSRIYSVKVKNNWELDNPSVNVFWGLPMMEGSVVVDGYLYGINESAAYFYKEYSWYNKSKDPTDVVWKYDLAKLVGTDMTVIASGDIINASATFKDDGKTGTVNGINLKQNWFSQDSMVYNHQLATLCSQYAMIGYDRVNGDSPNLRKALSSIGMKDIEIDSTASRDEVNYFIANRQISVYNKEYTLIFVGLIGSYHDQWYSNFDPGTGDTHKGFNSAKNFVYDHLDRYISELGIEKDETKILITGHSRGAAAANLLAAKLIKQGTFALPSNIYTYTFATPNPTILEERENEEYSRIFNIVNPEDFVTKCMPADWDYGRYGVTYVLPSKSNTTSFADYKRNMQKYYSSFTGGGTYNDYGGESKVYDAVSELTSAVNNVNEFYDKKLWAGFSNISAFTFFQNTLCHFVSKTATAADIALAGTLIAETEVSITSTNALRKILNYFIVGGAITDKFFDAHCAQTYCAYMSSLTAADMNYREGYMHSVNCPVDVEIYNNATEELVGKITNNVIDEEIAAKEYSIDMNVDGDSKIFWLPSDGDYTIKLIGNDEGTMDYSVSEIDSDTGELGRVNFFNVELSDGLTLTGSCECNDFVLEDYSLEYEDGNVLEPTERPEDVERFEITVSCEGHGTVSGSCTANGGDYISACAEPDDGYSFVGWYNGDTLVTDEAVYRFCVRENINLTAIFKEVKFSYEVYENDEAYITGYNDDENISAIIIPDTIDGYTVKGIDYGAFKGCTELKSVSLPDSVTSIGSHAFEDCINLTNITVGENINWVGDQAFCNTGYYNDESNWTDGVLYVGKCLIECDKNKSGECYIKSGTKLISNYAFEYCSELTEITIPNSVANIGYCAFEGCSGLKSITIPDSVTAIEAMTFYGCSSLESVTLGNTTRTIGDAAFQECSSLTEITIPDSVTFIDVSAFCGCESLTNISIPDGVTNISSCIFSNCTNLETVTVGNNIESIGNWAFSGCNKLTDFTIPDKVKTIGDGAFFSCASLTSVTIPDSVTSIGNSVFSGCTGLTTVTIGSGLANIENSAFDDCCSLTAFEIDSSNQNYSCDEYGVLYNKSKTEIIKYPEGKTNKEYVIPESVTTISNNAFCDCSSLKYIHIPSSVSSIPSFAFSRYQTEDKISICSDTVDCYAKTYAEENHIEFKLCSGHISKEKAISHLEELKDSFVCDDAKQIIDDAITVITGLDDSGEIYIAMVNAETNAAAPEKALADAKTVAKSELDKAKSNVKSDEAKSAIDTAIANIDKATNLNDVADAKLNGLTNAENAEKSYDEKTKFDKVSIKTATEKTIDYRSIVTVNATATGVTEGYKLAIYLGSQKVAEGDNKSVSYEYGELKSDLNYSVKVIDANGKVQKDSNGNDLSKDGGKITCNSGFFKKLIAFFKGLFKSLPKVEVKP